MSSVDALAAAIRGALERVREIGVGSAASRQAAEGLRERFAQLGADGKARRVAAIETGLEQQQAQAQASVDHAETVLLTSSSP